MDFEEDIQIISNNQLINIISSIIYWEFNKENILTSKDKNSSENIFLIDKILYNKIKHLINYEKIVSYFDVSDINSISKREIKKNVTQNIINYINDNDKKELNLLFSEENHLNEDIMINEIIGSKNFIFEVVNEEIKNNLSLEGKFFIQLKSHHEGEKIFFTIDKSFSNSFIFIFLNNENKLYQLILIVNNMNYESLIKIFETQNKNIINLLGINLGEINENNNLEKINIHNIELIFFIIRIKQFKNNKIENNQFINNNISTKNQNSNGIKKENILNLIHYLNNSNELFKKALNRNIGEMHNNYSPCKILNRHWMENFINIINNPQNIEQINMNIFNNYKSLIPLSLDNKDIYITDEIFFISLFPFFKELENNRDLFKDYILYLKDNKGNIIIEEEIFIFETLQNDINRRVNFLKIQNQKFLKDKMIKGEFELNEIYWEKLKMYINNNNFQGKNVNNSNIINKNNIEEKFYNPNEILLNLLEKEKMLNSRLQQLETLEQYYNNKNNNNITANNSINNINNVFNNISNNNNIINNNYNYNSNININNSNINSIFNYNNNFNTNNLKNNVILSNNYNIINNNFYQNYNIINNNNTFQQVTLNKLAPTIGLDNIGSTCYINAVLQCLAHCIELSENILSWYLYHSDKDKESKNISYSYAKVLYNLFYPQENQTSFSPNDFREIISYFGPLFEENQANDSKDIFQFLIQKIHEELNVVNNNNNYYNENIQVNQMDEIAMFNDFELMCQKNYNSVISKYFYGKQKTITKCLNCGSIMHNFQVFSFLIFPLLDVKKYTQLNYPNQNQGKILNIYDCFNYYQKIEFFSGENHIYCMGCKFDTSANYCILLYSSPIILTLILNRGKNNADFHDKFLFPIELDLNNYSQDKSFNNKFYLIGVICHVGESGSSGHFFAYCRSHYQSYWYKYNDSIVSECNESDIFLENTPYILFYHKYI